MACIKGGHNQAGIDAATSVLNTESASTHAKAYYWRATGHFNLKNHKQCVADCIACIKLQPKNKASRKLCKKSLEAQKKVKSAKAKRAFSEALSSTKVLLVSPSYVYKYTCTQTYFFPVAAMLLCCNYCVRA